MSPARPAIPADADRFLRDTEAVVGKKHVLTCVADQSGFLKDWRGRYSSDALAVVLPANTSEVSQVVRLCATCGLSVVPQAGNTGMTGGAIALDGKRSVVVNVSRMNRVREVDVDNNSMIVDAGCILENVWVAAEENKRLFPMLLGSVGSCEIGGLVSTNAGGTGVLRYGNMRDLVVGLEVVLPDGSVWNGLRALRKDNFGYDLKQFFIGAEGTLGIVTAAVLKLFPRLNSGATAMVSLPSVECAVSLLTHTRSMVGERAEAFEVMSREQLEIVLRHSPQRSSPVAIETPWYVILEVADSTPDWDAQSRLEEVLALTLEDGLVVDGFIFIGTALGFGVVSLNYEIGTAVRMGPGYMPLMLVMILGSLGVWVAFNGLRKLASGNETPGLRPVPWKGIALVVLALIMFGELAHGLGLVPVVFICTSVVAFASARNSFLQSLFIAAVMSLVCWAIFKVGLGVVSSAFSSVRSWACCLASALRQPSPCCSRSRLLLARHRADHAFRYLLRRTIWRLDNGHPH